MADSSESRRSVVNRYSVLARQAMKGETPHDCEDGATGCCGAANDAIDVPEAAVRASLGCGNPLVVADLHDGDTVLDLGSGAGLDALRTARRVGPTGTVYGLDASSDMRSLARSNAADADVANVHFLPGHIEHIPLADDHVDVVISNCVINLSVDKPRVLAEAFRVLHGGGHLAISDMIRSEHLQPSTPGSCGSNALMADSYRHILAETGFKEISITASSDPNDGLHSAIIRATKICTDS